MAETSNRKTYHEQTYIDNTLRLREILKTLPPFAKDYFRAVEPTTSARTRISYAYDIRVFFHFLMENNPVYKNYTIEQFEVHDLERLEPVDIEEYQEYLKVYKNDEEKCITNTEKGLARKMSALRSFYGYYFKRQIISKNPTLLVEMPKLHEKAIIRLDTDEIAMLLDYVDHGGDNLTGQRKAYFEKTKNRDLAILTLLLGTGIRVSECVGLDLQDIDFKNNGKSGLMGNKKIRQALAYSLNREEMIEAVYGRYVPSYGFISPAITLGDKSYREQVEEPMLASYKEYAGDSKKLQALFQEGLKELGKSTDLSKVTITYLSNGSTVEDNALREYLQQTWQQVLGIKVELNTVGDYSLLTAERDAGNFDVYQGGWFSDYNDPLDYLSTFYTGQYESVSGGYSNAEYDGLIDSLTGENDNAKRLEIYSQAEQVLFDDCAMIPLYYSALIIV